MSIKTFPAEEDVSKGEYQAQGSRDYQQDLGSILTYDKRRKSRLLVLCDGMGGMSGGEVFSRIGVEGMNRDFEQEAAKEDFSIIGTLMHCFSNARRDALTEQRSRDKYDRGGSTLTAVIAANKSNRFGWISSGDSRIYLYRDGLIQLTRDQNMGLLLDNSAALGRIGWHMTQDPGQRRAITGGLGDERAVPPDVCWLPTKLVDGDLVLLMSDGVFGTLDTQELEEIIRSEIYEEDGSASDSVSKLHQKIIDAVLEKAKKIAQEKGEDHQDNCSVIGFRYQESLSEKRIRRLEEKEKEGVFGGLFDFVGDLFGKKDADEPKKKTAPGSKKEDQGIRIDAGQAAAKGKRPNQEDSFWCSADAEKKLGFLAAVSDGCGGAAGQTAMRALQDTFALQDVNDAPDIRLLKMAAGAQKAVKQAADGCATLACVFVLGGKMWLLSIGNSRIALVRRGGMITLNRPHFAKKTDAPAGEREALSSYLGVDNLLQIDRTVTPVELKPGDRIVLMTDGVSDALLDEERENAVSDDEKEDNVMDAQEDAFVALLDGGAADSAKKIIKAVEKRRLKDQDNAAVVVLNVQ